MFEFKALDQKSIGDRLLEEEAQIRQCAPWDMT